MYGGGVSESGYLMVGRHHPKLDTLSHYHRELSRDLHRESELHPEPVAPKPQARLTWVPR